MRCYGYGTLILWCVADATCALHNINNKKKEILKKKTIHWMFPWQKHFAHGGYIVAEWYCLQVKTYVWTWEKQKENGQFHFAMS